MDSDFSVLLWEKDNFRNSLSDMRLEGMMQTKQYGNLETLALLEEASLVPMRWCLDLHRIRIQDMTRFSYSRKYRQAT